jgi:hypothetical protein
MEILLRYIEFICVARQLIDQLPLMGHGTFEEAPLERICQLNNREQVTFLEHFTK